MPTLAGRISLEPADGVLGDHQGYIATTREPWLRLNIRLNAIRRRWIKITYRSNLFDDPVRPVLRFQTTEGEVISLMNGAVLGRGAWLGRVPDHTTAIAISPTNRPGPFSFEIEDIALVRRRELVARAFLRDPKLTLQAIQLRLSGERAEARYLMKRTVSWTPIGQYRTWFRRNSRELDLDDCDTPRADWTAPVLLIVNLRGTSAAALTSTFESLRAQIYQRWSVLAVIEEGTSDSVVTELESFRARDSRFVIASGADSLTLSSERDLVGMLRPGDTLPVYSLACVMEAAARHSEWKLIYGDEDRIDYRDRPHSPLFKPDYSPLLQQATDYVGPLFMRGSALPQPPTTGNLLAETPHSILSTVAPAAVGHVRRILTRRRTGSPAMAAPAEKSQEEKWPSVTVIIPTRDRADLLSKCLHGLEYLTDYPSLQIVVVDNGSSEPAARTLLDSLKYNRRVRCLERPGPFNYSSLCNDGAAQSVSDVLVFLNNDVWNTDRGWLKELVSWARRGDVGAVGPKLLFPDGNVQHAGVVLGMVDLAGHPYYRAHGNDPGYLGRLNVPHEVTAVTGACLAVQRKKFNAVGGFDAENLPVSLSDIDLCLRLNEKGWRTIWTPSATLHHLESATRGYDLATTDRHRPEQEYFQRKWSHVIRDDPYFHPALSLDSQSIALA